jgi:hypothetical protein
MKSLAEALVHAVTYINCLPDPNEERTEEDVRTLEEMATYLATATNEEKDALAAAAQRAVAEEQSGSARPEYLNDYGTWMESMFGDEWEGNQRV